MTTPSLSRRTLLQSAIAASIVGTRNAFAQDYPTRPITLLVPWPAGGSTDISLRVLADEASKRLKQPINIENKPGAGGTLAMPTLTQSAPDGYTLAQLPLTIYRAPHTTKVLWHPLRDVTPILQISGTTFGLVVPATTAFQTVADVIEHARKNPGLLTVGSNGIGTTPHLVIEELFNRLKLTYIHVPYKGTAEQMLAVARGELMVGTGTGFGPYVESGKLRVLATFGEERTKRWSQVPTMKEQGYGIVAMSPYGIGGPKGMPKEIVKALHDAFKAAMFSPAFANEITKYDQELSYLNTEDYAQFAADTFAREKQWVEQLGIGLKSKESEGK
jgi:tripartite-type tricarboxylate transporter receptor subunit TctC